MRFLSTLRTLGDGRQYVGRMLVTQAVLGTGSAGTIVFEGSLDGRPIAVKRMLRQVPARATVWACAQHVQGALDTSHPACLWTAL